MTIVHRREQVGRTTMEGWVILNPYGLVLNGIYFETRKAAESYRDLLKALFYE